jgi:hypothetical protein
MDLHLAESVPLAARATRSGRTFTKRSTLGMRSDRPALSRRWLGGGVGVRSARNALTCLRFRHSILAHDGLFRCRPLYLAQREITFGRSYREGDG